MSRFLLPIVLLLAPQGAAAADAQREQYWSEALAAVAPAQLVWLEADGAKFLALYQEAGAARGGLILLHDMGGHADWPEVVAPLRARLPAHGWATLSLQLPVLAPDAPARDYVPLFDETAARIQAGIGFLQGRGIRNIAVVGYGLGAAMGATFLAEHGGAGVTAFAAVAIPSYPEIAPRLDAGATLAKIALPVLDLYGERDLDAVRDTAPARRAAAARRAGLSGEAGPISYRQLEIGGADHAFTGQEDTLVRRVAGWLKRHAEGKVSKSEALPN